MNGLISAGGAMQQRRDDRTMTTGRLAYHPPEITDLGSVVELTEANSNSPGGQYDGAGYSATGHS
jgi:hypothetical protein